MRGAVLSGTVLIGLGAWLLAANLGWPVPGLDRLWPAFLALFGVASLTQYLARGRAEAGLVFAGVTALLAGAFFFAFTLGPWTWSWDRWWPALLVIAGLGGLARWLTQPRDLGRLGGAALLLAVGGVALASAQGWLASAWLLQVVRYWPVLLIVAGLIVVARQLLAGRAPRR